MKPPPGSSSQDELQRCNGSVDPKQSGMSTTLSVDVFGIATDATFSTADPVALLPFQSQFLP